MKLLFTKPIPPNPAPSKIIPIISETLYIYLIGFQFRHFADVHPVPFFSDGPTKPRVKHKAVLRDIKEAV